MRLVMRSPYVKSVPAKPEKSGSIAFSCGQSMLDQETHTVMKSVLVMICDCEAEEKSGSTFVRIIHAS